MSTPGDGRPGVAEELRRRRTETLALLLSRGLLCAERDDHANGRPLVYRPTPQLLQLLRAETLEEARGRLEVPADYRFQAEPTSETEPPVRQGRSSGGRPALRGSDNA